MLGLKKKPDLYPTDTNQWVDTERAWGARPGDHQLTGIRNAGVITVVHLTPDGEPVAMDQSRAQQHGLFYLPVKCARGRIEAAEANRLLDLLNLRQNAPFYLFDEDGSMAGVVALLFKAIPNFWPFDRYKEEAARRGIRLDAHPELEASIKAYMKRYVRGRR